MTGIILPILLSVTAIVAMLYAYSGIRRGGARVYTLEREAILRRSTSAMLTGTLLFIAAVGWLIYQDQIQPDTTITTIGNSESSEPSNSNTIDTVEGGDVLIPAATTPQPDATNQLPALDVITLTPTIDPDVPTATPTPIVVRGFVTGTGGNGLTLRDTPGGEQLDVLDEDEFVTILEDEGQLESNGITWVKVRTFLGDEGWVALDFLEVEGR